MTLFAQHPALRRAATALALALVTIAGTACDGELDIVHGLNELEANEILVVLASQSVKAKKFKEEGRVVTWGIIVPESQAQDALSLLVRNKLPKERSVGLAEVYPAGGGGLIPTKSEELAKFLMAIQGELERKLKTLPGIVQAHVSVVVPDKDVIRDIDTPPPPPTASVAIVYNPTREKKPPIEIDEVKELVAAGVEALTRDHVKVIMKENIPTHIIGNEGAPQGVVSAGETVMGIKFATKKASRKAKMLFGLFGGVAVLGLVLGLFGIIRSISLKGKLSKAQAEAAALKKAQGGAPMPTG